MENSHLAASSVRPAAKLSTEALAAKFSAQPQTPRASYCRHGHWMGMIPTKLPNGRLLWDESEANALLAGRPAVTRDAAQAEEHAARKAAESGKRLLPHIRAKVEAKAARLTGEAAK
jgi:hypothetical protein